MRFAFCDWAMASAEAGAKLLRPERCCGSGDWVRRAAAAAAEVALKLDIAPLLLCREWSPAFRMRSPKLKRPAEEGGASVLAKGEAERLEPAAVVVAEKPLGPEAAVWSWLEVKELARLLSDWPSEAMPWTRLEVPKGPKAVACGEKGEVGS